MAKSKKKKNYKLRRRVMRTVAAITMIMAIVVAAIPVENYGTMQAADTALVAELVYLDGTGADYDDKYDPSVYEGTPSTAPADQLNIQRIENNVLLNLFTAVKKNADTAVIVDDDNMSNILSILEIRKLDYYNYVELNGDFITSINNTFQNIEFSLEFSDADNYKASGSGNVGGTSSPGFDSFSLTKLSTTGTGKMNANSVALQGTLQASNGLSLVNAREYIGYDLNKISGSDKVNEIFTGCASEAYASKKSEIDEYNNKIVGYINTIQTIQARVDAGTATDADLRDWNEIKDSVSNGAIKTEYSNAKNFNMTYGQFVERGSNGLTLLTDYIIRNTVHKNNVSGETLAGYALINVELPSGGTAYIPKLKNGENTVGNQYKDNNGYLVGGKVEIEGIKSEAFKENSIVENLTISDEIKYIGQEAFAKSGLRSISIGQNCVIIGDRAFKESNYLETVKFTGNTPQLKTIGKQAFENVKELRSISIPESVTTVGAGCFGNSVLENLEFKEGGQEPITILPYAFYNCNELKQVSFPGNKEIKIKKAAFASAANHGGGENLKEFIFPKKNSKIDYASSDIEEYDYILANRRFLETVTLPGSLNNKIPDNTFAGCSGLKNVIFPEDAKSADYDPDKLFQGVMNADFFVTGPAEGLASGSKATPRTTTWKAKAGYDGGKGVVPYMFKDSTGTHYEIGDKKDENGVPEYIARIDVISENPKEASLVKYSPNKEMSSLGDNISITIPDKVGGENGYKVVAIGADCFEKEIKEKISELITKDDSIRRIEDQAFKDATNLQWVEIGDSVTYIGKEAFFGCSRLENVVFSQNQTAEWYGQDNYWAEALTIGENAFKTGSSYLTFHGAIHPDYAPFRLAMSENNEKMLNSKSRICYTTDAPLNLTVIRSHEYTNSDNTKVPEKITLIDYPHYEEIDTINADLREKMQEQYNEDNSSATIQNYSITDKFEAVNNLRKSDVDYSKYETMGDEEAEVIEQTLYLDLPKGIESIDSKLYYNNSANANDVKYLNFNYTRKTANGVVYERSDDKERNLNIGTSYDTDPKALYATYEGPGTDKVKTVPGITSGYFNESTQETEPTADAPIDDTTKGLIWRTYADHYYKEKNNRGNDYLTTVTMPSVTYMPDYAFDSNENLKELTFGSALSEIGLQPFRDCKSLWNIDTTDSTKYVYENMILYDTDPVNGKDGYKIVQGLEGRGSDAKDGQYGSNKITATSNPLLSQVAYIAPYAFANNEEVVEVDLSKTNIRDIENGAFNGSGNLMKVVLSEKTKVVGDFAFGGVNANNFTLEVPNKDCQISQKAFKRDDEDTSSSIKGVTIKGIKYDENGDRSTTYDSFLKLQETYGENRVEWAEIGKTHTLNFYDQQTLQLIASVKVETKEGETSATMVGNPPTPPGHTGYEFDYWMCPKILDANGNPLLDAATWTDVTEDRDIYAVYKRSPETVVPDGKDYTLTVVNGKALVKDANGELQLITTFPLTLKGGTQVTIMANDEPNFKTWSASPVKYQSLLQNSGTYTTTLTMPNDNLTVTANSAIGGGNTPNPDGTYTVTVNNGTGSGQYKAGATVTITANKPNTGASFVNWTTATSGVSFASATSATTTFVMPSSNVTVTANFSDGSGGQPGGDKPGGDDSKKKYKVTVNYGTGSGEYEVGATVNITANAPESSSRVFSRWTTSNSSLGFANANASSTSFVMPAADVTVTANYKTKSKDDDDDDDDDSPSRRPGSSSSTNTVPNRPGSSSTTGTTGTVTDSSTGSGNTSGTTNSSDGNKIYITKNGISNTDVASLAVSGSTDNFIVRITESPEATAAVEQALTNSYGSLEGLAYLPMDISLYDSTGQNKITDTHGLNITVTMPIPDVLIQYGGNARVAAADNGNLQQITPRFTTIDGIACISFVPPHFSPYVIYVDTNNLIAGQMLDATPATGDPIHPKWFAAIGMACVSVLLFVASDGRKRKKFRAA